MNGPSEVEGGKIETSKRRRGRNSNSGDGGGGNCGPKGKLNNMIDTLLLHSQQ